MEGPQRNAGEVVSLGLVQSITKSIQETKQLVNDVPVSKSNFLMLVFYLGELQPLVEDLSKEDQQLLNSFPVWSALNRLEGAASAAHQFTKSCTSRSRIFLLYKVENLMEDIRRLVKDVADGISVMPDTLPPLLKDGFEDLKAKMEGAGFYIEPSHLQIASEMAEGVAAQLVDETFATNLLKRIAEVLSVPIPGAAELKLELQQDLESVEWDRDSTNLQDLRNLCDLLTPAAVLADVRRLAFQESGLSRYGSLTVNRAFFCPITGQVMRDPVMLTEAGFTYEREAIMEWFNRGHRTCPDTGKELESLELVPNYNLREAIEEFSDRVSRGELTTAIDTIREWESGSVSDADLREAVETIKSLSDTNPKYTRLIASMDGIQPLVGIVKKQKEKMPVVWDKVLRVLASLAAIGDEYRIMTVRAGIIPTLIRHLWRNDGDNLIAMQLLYEISKVDIGVNGIIESEKSIVCIVHATRHQIVDIKQVASKILQCLCHNRRELAINVASYQVFDPLVAMLSSEYSLEVRAAMARAVVDLDLTEEGYVALMGAGAVSSLVDMLNTEHVYEGTFAAATALQHLSSMEVCRVPICEASAVPALLRFLLSEDQDIRIAVMETLANLARDHQGATEIEQQGAATYLLSILKRDLHGPMQEYALKTLECLAKETKTARLTVKENGEVTHLVSFLQADNLSTASRASVLHLLCHLADDRETRECVILPEDGVGLLISLLNQTSDAEEQESIFGIFAGLSKLPRGPEMVSNPAVLESLVKFLDCGTVRSQEYSAVALSKLLESSRATIREHQLVGRLGAIPFMTRLVVEGSVRGRCYAANVLGLLSRFTPTLTEPLTFIQMVAGILGVAKFKSCKVHGGKCSSRKTLCLVEAGAAARLFDLLGQKESKTAEKAVDALSTLIQDERCKANGLSFLVKNDIINKLIGVVGKNASLTEKAVTLMEQIFRDRRFREEKYYKPAQPALYKIIATGRGPARRTAAHALEHVGLFSRGSTYTS